MTARSAKSTPRQPTRGKTAGEKISVKPETTGLRKLSWMLILGGTVVLLVLWLFFSYFDAQGYCDDTKQHQGIKVVLSSSGYLPPGDTQQIQVTAINEYTSTATITVTLSYSGTSMCLAGNDRSHTVTFKSLPRHGRATGQMEVQFPLCLQGLSPQNRPRQRAEFNVWLAVNSQPPQDLGSFSLPVMAIPRSRALGHIFGSFLAVLAGWTGKELWKLLNQAQESASTRPRARKSG